MDIFKAIAQSRGDQSITDAVMDAAIARGDARKGLGIHATGLRYSANREVLTIEFEDKSSFSVPISNYPELAILSESDRRAPSLGVGGSAVTLDSRDLHISIAGLIKASQPLANLVRVVYAGWLGSKTSSAKAIASKENGRLGGRPRKQQPV